MIPVQNSDRYYCKRCGGLKFLSEMSISSEPNPASGGMTCRECAQQRRLGWVRAEIIVFGIAAFSSAINTISRFTVWRVLMTALCVAISLSCYIYSRRLSFRYQQRE